MISLSLSLSLSLLFDVSFISRSLSLFKKIAIHYGQFVLVYLYLTISILLPGWCGNASRASAKARRLGLSDARPTTQEAGGTAEATSATQTPTAS